MGSTLTPFLVIDRCRWLGKALSMMAPSPTEPMTSPVRTVSPISTDGTEAMLEHTDSTSLA